MRLYLVQHGEAKSEQEDPQRPLTDKGREETERMAEFLAKIGLEVDEVWHSTKLRAKQTAEILASKIKVQGSISKVEGLAPNDDPKPIREKIETQGKDLMIVSHLPFLSRLTSLLLINDPEREIVKFRMSGIVALVKENGSWKVDWIVKPELVD